MDETAFEELVEEAVASIPDVFLEMLDNVALIVEDWPDRETMRLARVRSHYQLLGFYHGVPKTGRTSGYNLVAPDRISIYRRPIEAQCRTQEELREWCAAWYCTSWPITLALVTTGCMRSARTEE